MHHFVDCIIALFQRHKGNKSTDGNAYEAVEVEDQDGDSSERRDSTHNVPMTEIHR